MAVNLLLSFAYAADADLAQLRADLTCGEIMLDSGAFTAHTTGKTIRLDDYAAYLQRWSGCWDHAVTLDVVGDPAATARNTRRLHERGLPVMPVFTRGQALIELDAMVRDHGYVCVGGLVGMQRSDRAGLRARVQILQRRAQDMGGGIHALGVGSTPNLRATRPYSADSSAISQVFRFGRVAYWDGRNVVSVKIDDRDRLRKDFHHIRAQGIDLADLATNGQRGRPLRMYRQMALSYVIADEAVQRFKVPAPRPELRTGTVLYNSVLTLDEAAALADLGRHLHSPDAPLIWQRHARAHTCQRKAPSHA